MARKKTALPPVPDSPVRGKRFCLERTLRKGPLRDWIARRGGSPVVVDHPDDSDYLVLPEARRGRPKLPIECLAAKRAGDKIATIYENDLAALLLPSREEALAVLAGGAANREAWKALLPPSVSPLRIDLAGADLGGLDLSNFELRNCNFDGVRLDGTNLDNTAIDHPKNVDFRAIRRPGSMSIDNPERCCFRGMKLDKISLDDPVACDFTEADFTGASFFGQGMIDVVAERANFHRAHLRGKKLQRAKLAGANFTEATLTRAVLDGADLREANCAGANLGGASLQNADLRRASFRNANLGGADLTGAKITGTDFTGANLHNVKGLPAARLAKVRPGTHLLRLEAALMDVADWQLQFALALAPRGRAEVELERCSQWEHGELAQTVHLDRARSGRFASDVFDVLRNLAREHAGAVPLLDTVRVTPGTLEAQLGELPLQALCEVFGQPIPTAEQAGDARQTAQERANRARQEIMDGLRSGPAGVERWNGLDRVERKALSNLKKIDLSRCRLAGVNFRWVDCTAANFEAADLSQADLYCAILGKSNLKGADLSGVAAGGLRLTGANLEGANLRGGDFSYAHFQKANLTGADLTGATLTRAEYDAGTIFPAGFDPKAAGMVLRTPKAKKPAAAAPPPPSADFASFFARLPTVADPGRIRNAVSMLRAEKFQLFARTAEDRVIGVVRSQSSAERVYACRLTSTGQFECGTQNLRPCGGLQGAVCKHLLVLVLGLTKAGKLDGDRAFRWLELSRGQRPTFDKEVMTATFLEHKGAEAGEVDWRPTETVPEDYYSL